MKIALVNPPFLPGYTRGSRSPAVARSGTLYYPYDLVLAGAVLAREGHQVTVIDAIAEQLSDLLLARRLQQFAPEMIVVAAALASAGADIRRGEILKDACGAALLLATAPLSAEPREWFARHPALDGVVIGIPAAVVPAWAASHHSVAASRRTVPEGMVWRPGEQVLPVPGRPFIPDELPWVTPAYRRWLPLRPYFYACAPHPVVTVRSGYGCPCHCSFCAPRPLTARRSPEQLVAELAWVAADWPAVRAVFFEDDTFTYDPAWLEEFCRVKLRGNNQLLWSANARADVPAPLLDLMRRAGCYSLTVGFESRSGRILEQMEKGVTLEQMEQFAASAAGCGIKLHGCFILGWPGERDAAIEQTIAWAERLPLDTAQFYPPQPLPGSGLGDAAAAAGWPVMDASRPWLTSDGHHRAADSRRRDWCRVARRRYYLRPGYWFYRGRQLCSDPDTRYRTVRSLKTFIPALLGERVQG